MLLQHGDPVPYEEKRPVALWRGVTTGTGDWDPEGDPGNPQPAQNGTGTRTSWVLVGRGLLWSE